MQQGGVPSKRQLWVGEGGVGRVVRGRRGRSGSGRRVGETAARTPPPAAAAGSAAAARAVRVQPAQAWGITILLVTEYDTREKKEDYRKYYLKVIETFRKVNELQDELVNLWWRYLDEQFNLSIRWICLANK